MKRMRICFIIILAVIFSGCAPRVILFPDAAAPLQEFTLEGTGKEKILLIPVSGIISDRSVKSGFRSSPGMVQEIVAHLEQAEEDKQVKAILLKVDSPGGSTTASDILHNEILSFKKNTNAKVVVAMMNVAASGGYYISLPADRIFAHPTTITGSIGVIFMRPGLTGLMEKVGVTMEVNKSGSNKDMMSPYREPTNEEIEIIQNLTDGLAKRFTELVARHRDLDDGVVSQISSARVYLADEALKLGLVDRIGYLEDAIKETKKIAGLEEDARLVVYRRTRFNNDNLYNTSTSRAGSSGSSKIDIGIPRIIPELESGFYYVWAPALGLP